MLPFLSVRGPSAPSLSEILIWKVQDIAITKPQDATSTLLFRHAS